jgi:hypothetical protein
MKPNHKNPAQVAVVVALVVAEIAAVAVASKSTTEATDGEGALQSQALLLFNLVFHSRFYRTNYTLFVAVLADRPLKPMKPIYKWATGVVSSALS